MVNVAHLFASIPDADSILSVKMFVPALLATQCILQHILSFTTAQPAGSILTLSLFFFAIHYYVHYYHIVNERYLDANCGSAKKD